MSRKRIPLNQNECTADFRIGVPFEQNLHAKEIREYIQAMIDSGNEDITPEWIEWALKKADWYDPSIETEDEYLGKRQHEKSAEEKEKSLQDSIRKSWYW